MPKSVLLQGDCLEVLKELPDDSVDSLVCDPPAGIAFMGKAWDEDKGGSKQWIAWLSSVMVEAKRVMKPGAHGFVWALPRTSHCTATALEDAGFEIRDVVTHLFGSGFPKSHNIEKATKDERFKGFGTALKPASEHWILVRKPLEKGLTIAENVLKHGAGGINIDASRIGTEERTYSINGATKGGNFGNYANQPALERDHKTATGRFPANLILSCCGQEPHDENCAVAELDRQSGVSKSGSVGIRTSDGFNANSYGKGMSIKAGQENGEYGDKGGASRFFYVAKASKREKNAGC